MHKKLLFLAFGVLCIVCHLLLVILFINVLFYMYIYNKYMCGVYNGISIHNIVKISSYTNKYIKVYNAKNNCIHT